MRGISRPAVVALARLWVTGVRERGREREREGERGRERETTGYEPLHAAQTVVAGEGGDVQSARGGIGMRCPSDHRARQVRVNGAIAGEIFDHDI